MPVVPILALTSDWHLCPSAWKRPHHPSRDSYASVKHIVDSCIDYRIPLIGAGDLFDELKPDTLTLKFAFEQVDRLRSAGLRLLLTQGQHEKAVFPYLSLHTWPEHIDRREVDVAGLRVVGSDHVSADVLPARMKSLPRDADIMVLHQVWSNFMGTGTEGDLSLAVETGAKRILTGDYHVHKSIDVLGVPVHSPGSVCLLDIAEETEKKFFVLMSDGSVRSDPLPTRKVHKLVVESEEALQDVLSDMDRFVEPVNSLPPDIRVPILSVHCYRGIDGAKVRLEKAVRNRAFLFWKPIDLVPTGGTEYVLGPGTPVVEPSMSKKEAIEKACKGDELLCRDISALLDETADPKKLLQEMEIAHMGGPS